MPGYARARALLLCSTILLGACGSKDGMGMLPHFDLVFKGDDSFETPHGGQPIHLALVEDGDVLRTRDGTVESTGFLSFNFALRGVLPQGEAYEVHYWIDSNSGGGTVGVCDPPPIDLAWRVMIPAVSEDVTIEETYRPNETEDVCSSF